MSGIDNVTAAVVLMQSASTRQGVGVALVKQQLDDQAAVLQLVTVATDAIKGQAVDTTV